MLFTGQFALDGATGQISGKLATLLDASLLHSASKIEWIDDKLRYTPGDINTGFGETFEIASAAELVDFANKVSDGMIYADAKLTKDLNLLAYRSKLIPIGSSISPYKGTFDGQGHKIQNIGGMMFGTVEGATIKNIGLESGTIVQNLNYAQYTGTLVGSCEGTTPTPITNCYSKVNLSSATNDAGTGMLQALGFRFYDNEGNLLGQGGEILEKISSTNQKHVHPSLKNAHFIVACDVQNPFFGPNGAAHIFARQKRADDAMIADLDKGMRSFAKVIHKETGRDISLIPGSGAAGGMGGGLMAFLNAELKSGADLLLDICHFEEAIKGADLIITGEGRIDHQSLMGKIPGKILAKGIKYGIPVIAIAGCVEDREALNKAGFKGIYEVKPKDMLLETAMQQDVAIRNIQETISRIES